MRSMNGTLTSPVQQQKLHYLEGNAPKGGGVEPMKAQDRGISVRSGRNFRRRPRGGHFGQSCQFTELEASQRWAAV